MVTLAFRNCTPKKRWNLSHSRNWCGCLFGAASLQSTGWFSRFERTYLSCSLTVSFYAHCSSWCFLGGLCQPLTGLFDAHSASHQSRQRKCLAWKCYCCNQKRSLLGYNFAFVWNSKFPVNSAISPNVLKSVIRKRLISVYLWGHEATRNLIIGFVHR